MSLNEVRNTGAEQISFQRLEWNNISDLTDFEASMIDTAENSRKGLFVLLYNH